MWVMCRKKQGNKQRQNKLLNIYFTMKGVGVYTAESFYASSLLS